MMKLIPARGRVSEPAHFLVGLGLRLSCLILSAALLFRVYIGGPDIHTLPLYRLLADLYRAPMGVLLITSLGALIVEDAVR